jgi:hypothetical protein
MHKPLGAAFEEVLTAIGMGFGKGKSTPKPAKKKSGRKHHSRKAKTA